jgi:Rap1a immunity proteins
MSARITSSLFGAALALTVTAATAADEDINSANYYLPSCQEFVARNGGAISGRQGICGGMVHGIAFMGKAIKLAQFDYSGSYSSSIGMVRSYCLDIPNNVTVTQVTRVVVSYIEAHPDRMHELFAWLAVEALRDAWPCR